MKTTITLAILLSSLVGFSQTKPIPDTTVNLKTTNNQLYQLYNLLTVANQNLLKSQMAVSDYVEFQKEYQELLKAWFLQKKEQDDKMNKKVPSK